MLISELTLRCILSFGGETPPLKLRPLNLLIGPNGSGKSNLIEVIGLLQAAPRKLTSPMRGQGASGVAEWIWKGAKQGPSQIEALIEYPAGRQPLRHRIAFTETAARFELVDEVVEYAEPDAGHAEPFFFYRYGQGHPMISAKDASKRELRRDTVASDESILSQRKSAEEFPEITDLGKFYEHIRLYREWSFGRTSLLRLPQPTDMPNDRLEEDFSNLGLFLNRLRGKPAVKKRILERLRDLYAGLDDFDVRIEGGTVQVFLTEGEFTIPASRLSDGTLRYLCLLAILCDTDPPPLICIEEPELGLHPDLLPKIAELLISASERTQLIVTTHSDILLDAMTEYPEAVVVMEKLDGQTRFKRLENDDELRTFLEDYRLGEMWLRGFIGGTRW